MKSSAKKIELASVDDLFSTEEGRQDAKLEKIQEIPLSELHPFKNHPFKVKDDEAMMETADSIKQYGVLVPAIARPDPEGGYELVAGHRRHRASELAEKETMPVIVRDLDDDAATIIMVDSNLQRESLLPSERAFAYAVLEEKAAAATAHHNDLSAQIKAAEKRMAEIAVLRTHIVNYAKTREVYVAYRKAGYSKKFREEHEEEILLHQAAKNAFDEMGVKKLPKVKELQMEYAKLLEEKKKTYAEYRRSREEMRELLTAKANVDRVLKMEVEQDVEKEKDHGQR